MIHAASGYDMAHLAYQPGRSRPDYCGIYHADVVTGTYGFGAIASALYQRTVTGQGQHIDVSMLESMLTLTVIELQGAQFAVKPLPRPMFGLTKTANGDVMITVASEKTFQCLMGVIGRPEWITDARFSSYAPRRENWADMMDGVEAWSKQLSTEACLVALSAAGVPASAYRTIKEALADPQLAHRQALSSVEDGGGSSRCSTCPSGCPAPTPRRARRWPRSASIPAGCARRSGLPKLQFRQAEPPRKAEGTRLTAGLAFVSLCRPWHGGVTTSMPGGFR